MPLVWAITYSSGELQVTKMQSLGQLKKKLDPSREEPFLFHTAEGHQKGVELVV